MYGQVENIEVHGNFLIYVLKKRVKEEICKNLAKSHSCLSRINKPKMYVMERSIRAADLKSMPLFNL